jgi:hypothetical protein
MERSNVRVGCGLPIGDDSIWLDGHTPPPKDVMSVALSIKFGKRRLLLANYLYVFRQKGSIL